jgi:putative intracellular protease/amidase
VRFPSFCSDDSHRPDSIGIRTTRKIKGKEHEKTNGAVLFLAEVELMRRGAIVEKKANPQPSSVVDDRLITGQNPAPSTVAAQNVINLIAATKAA